MKGVVIALDPGRFGIAACEPGFDLRSEIFGLVPRKDEPHGSVWTTRLWINFFSGAVTAVLGSGAAWACLHLDQFNGGLFAAVVLGFFGLIGLFALGVMGYRTLERGRLVIDQERGELRFFYTWLSLWPRRVLRLRDVRSLGARGITVADSESSYSFELVFAELNDGRLVSIAADSLGNVRSAIQRAIELSR